MKLVTTAAVLDALGPDERLRTTVETAGRLDAFGRVLGDVYLVGRGDPNLSGRFSEGRITAAFEELADALRAAGVRRIEGRLVGHEGLFAGDRRGEDWAWEDLVWWYGAEVSALSFNDNCADLTVLRGRARGRSGARRARAPSRRYYRVVSTAVTSAAGTAPALVLTRAPGLERAPDLRHLPARGRAVDGQRGARGPGALRGHRLRRGAGGPRHRGRGRGRDHAAAAARRDARAGGAREPAALGGPEGGQQAEPEPARGELLRLLGARPPRRRQRCRGARGRPGVPEAHGRRSRATGRCRTAPASRARTC